MKTIRENEIDYEEEERERKEKKKEIEKKLEEVRKENKSHFINFAQ